MKGESKQAHHVWHWLRIRAVAMRAGVRLRAAEEISAAMWPMWLRGRTSLICVTQRLLGLSVLCRSHMFRRRPRVRGGRFSASERLLLVVFEPFHDVRDQPRVRERVAVQARHRYV